MKLLSHVRLFVTPWSGPYLALPSMDFPGKSTGVGCHFLLQGIFLTQGSNPGLPHCRQTLCHLSHQGSHMLARSCSKYFKLIFNSTWPENFQMYKLDLEKAEEPEIRSNECWITVMPSSHLILCRPLILLTSIPPSIRVFSSESTLHIKWPKYWSVLPFPSPGDLPDAGIEPRSPAL